MKIAIGCDHGGISLKKNVLSIVSEYGHQVVDVGTDSEMSVDYPKYAKAVCDMVSANECEAGILICGTGIGMSMAANRNKDIRAALCADMFTARMSREHNNANVLCLGARVIGPGVAEEIVRTWLATEFAGDRHLRRIEMF